MSVGSLPKPELEFGNVVFLRRRKYWSTWRKTSQSREENQQQTQPTYDGTPGNRARDTLVGGDPSQHYAIPAPLCCPLIPITQHQYLLLGKGVLLNGKKTVSIICGLKQINDLY